jgi:aryl-alcohol dehydrogenase-like predicted oxidoreductase
MNTPLTRRDFLQQSAALASTVTLLGGAAVAAPAAPALPRRTLGRTGLSISTLSLGCGKFFQNLPEGQWEPVLQRALDLGVNYLDEASAYHFDKKLPHSEARLGQRLPAIRKQVYVCTKLDERDPEKAKPALEACLQRLRTDYVDVLMIHSITEKETDFAAMEKGIYAQFRKWKDTGVARFIGFSSMMTNGPLLAQWIDALDPDVALLAMNATKYGRIAEHALPAAKKRNTGVIAMKALRDIVGKDATAPELLRYSGTLPGVASLLVSHSSVRELEENVQTVGALTRIAGDFDRAVLERRVAHLATPDVLTWTRPDYRDGALA